MKSIVSNEDVLDATLATIQRRHKPDCKWRLMCEKHGSVNAAIQSGEMNDQDTPCDCGDEATLKNVFVVLVLGYWGKGNTLEEAARNCHKEGAKLSAKVVARMFCNVTPTQQKEIVVDSFGTINHPFGTECHRVISPADGHKVTLGSIMGKA